MRDDMKKNTINYEEHEAVVRNLQNLVDKVRQENYELADKLGVEQHKTTLWMNLAKAATQLNDFLLNQTETKNNNALL